MSKSSKQHPSLLSIPSVKPRNPTVAPMLHRSGSGKHTKGQKTIRQHAQKELRQQLAQTPTAQSGGFFMSIIYLKMGIFSL